MNKVMTLCIIHTEDRVLLGLKKRGFGVGRWNGFGGKLEKDEMIIDAAFRETKEEAGISPKDLVERGVLTFEFENDPDLLEVHVFSSSSFGGEPTETEEMRPQWFSHDEIPFDAMWPDDKYWFPSLLAGKKFSGWFKFHDTETILEHQLSESETLLDVHS